MTDQTPSYYGYAEIGLYALIALLCGLRARSAWAAYSVCAGIFVLWTFPAMVLDGYLRRDVPGIGYLVVAPIYALVSPLIYFVVSRIRPQRPKPSPESAWIVRTFAFVGRIAGRGVRLVFKGSSSGELK